jgi:hypothetical protein
VGAPHAAPWPPTPSPHHRALHCPQIVRVAINWMQATAILASFDIKGPPIVSRYLSFTAMGDGVSLNFFPQQCALRNRSFYGQYYT